MIASSSCLPHKRDRERERERVRERVSEWEREARRASCRQEAASPQGRLFGQNPVTKIKRVQIISK